MQDLYELRLVLGERVVVRQTIGPAASRDLFIGFGPAAKLHDE